MDTDNIDSFFLFGSLLFCLV